MMHVCIKFDHSITIFGKSSRMQTQTYTNIGFIIQDGGLRHVQYGGLTVDCIKERVFKIEL